MDTTASTLHIPARNREGRQRSLEQRFHNLLARAHLLLSPCSWRTQGPGPRSWTGFSVYSSLYGRAV